MTRVLDIDNLTVRFGGVTAVDGASFSVGAGELLGFIGPNGAGKTTVMRAITGIVTPQEGRILLAGQDLAGLSVDARIRRGLALAQQIVQPFRQMTVLDNVVLARGGARTIRPLRTMFQQERTAETIRARELLDLVGLGDAAEAMPSTLPLGYLKRLEVARALALDPKLLLLDEPLAGLNQNEARTLADLILALNTGGQTILLIEHNLREVTRICPRLYVQDNGRPLSFGPTDEVMRDRHVLDAYLGAGSDA